MQIVRRSTLFAALTTPLALAACGGAPTTTLSVTCNGQLALAGAKQIKAQGDTLTFPDPINKGQTNNISLSNGQQCVITPVVDDGGGHN